MTDIADDIALHRLQVSTELRREALDKHDQMRRLTATVLYRDGDSPEAEQIGRVTGWLSRDFDPELLAAAGDSVGPQAGVLTFFAEEIIKAEPGLPFTAVLLVDRVVLDPQWRGHGISPTVLERVLSVLQLDPQRTLTSSSPSRSRQMGAARSSRATGVTPPRSSCGRSPMPPTTDPGNGGLSGGGRRRPSTTIDAASRVGATSRPTPGDGASRRRPTRWSTAVPPARRRVRAPA